MNLKLQGLRGICWLFCIVMYLSACQVGDWTGLEHRGQVRKAATTRKDGDGVRYPRFAEYLRCSQTYYPSFCVPVQYYSFIIYCIDIVVQYPHEAAPVSILF